MVRKIVLFGLIISMLSNGLHAMPGSKSLDPRQKDFSTLNPGYAQYIIDSGQTIKYAALWTFGADSGFVVFDVEAINNQAILGHKTIDFLFSDKTEDNQLLCKITLFDAYSKGTVTLTDHDNNDYTNDNYTINDPAFKLASPSYWITFNQETISFGKGRDYTDTSTVLVTWKLKQDLGKNKKVYFTFNNAGSPGYYLMIKNITWGNLDKIKKKPAKKEKKRTSKKLKKKQKKHRSKNNNYF